MALPSHRSGNQFLVGITGGIGSGKSRVCRCLAELGNFPVVDLDQICRQLLQPHELGWQALKALLPDEFFANGQLDRRRLRKAIFADSGLRGQVDAVLHPLARQAMQAQLEQLPGPVALAEIPLLYEAGWQDAVQLTVVVHADLPVRLRRIMERDKVAEEQARQAIDAQMCLLRKAALADWVIDNSGDWENTCRQLRQLAEHYGVFSGRR